MTSLSTLNSSSDVSSSSSPATTFVIVNTTTNRSSSSVETTSHITTAISLDSATKDKVSTNNLSGGGITGIVVGALVAVILVIVTWAYVKRRFIHRHSGKTPNLHLPNKELQQKEMRIALENTVNVIIALDTFEETVPKSEYANVDSSCNRLENTNPALEENGYLKMISPSPAESKNGKPSSHTSNKNIWKDVIMNNKKSNRKHRSSIATTSAPLPPIINSDRAILECTEGPHAKGDPNKHSDNRNEEIKYLNDLPDHGSQGCEEYVNWNVGDKIDPASADNEQQLKQLQYSTVNKDVNSKQHQTSLSVQGQGTSARTYVNMNSNTAGANKAISLCAKSKNADSRNISNAEIHYVNENGYVIMNKTPETVDKISSQDELYEN